MRAAKIFHLGKIRWSNDRRHGCPNDNAQDLPAVVAQTMATGPLQ